MKPVMRAHAALAFSLLCAVAVSNGTLSVQAAPSSSDPAAEAAAVAFGDALRGDMERLSAVLPARGKVRLRLASFGAEDGLYSAGQVRAWLIDFLRSGRVGSFVVVRVECERGQVAMVHAKAAGTDRQGRALDVRLHLTLQPEERRWVLREVRETSP
jgi:hypothetical protein